VQIGFGLEDGRGQRDFSMQLQVVEKKVRNGRCLELLMQDENRRGKCGHSAGFERDGDYFYLGKSSLH